MDLIITILRLTFTVLSTLVEVGLWTLYSVGRMLAIGSDAARVPLRLPGGVLRCPAGHAIPTEGADQTYQCAGCGFVYRGGSVWVCANPECGATTPYTNCPTCGLSVRNPYRWG